MMTRGAAQVRGQALSAKPRKRKNRNGDSIAVFVGRTPGNFCCRCFLSDLTELAVLPPSGLANALLGKRAAVNA